MKTWAGMDSAERPATLNGCAEPIDLFLRQALLDGNRPAVVVSDLTVSYAELEERARRYAACFSASASPRVMIAVRSGVEAYAAMLGTGLAGGWYTPLNVDAPMAKLRTIAGLVQPDLIVADAGLAGSLGEAVPGARLVSPGTSMSARPMTGAGTRHEIAYVIFTSGSTGTPKGVVVNRSGLAHFVGWLRGSESIKPSDRVSQHANIAFDLSVLDIYGALCCGAALYPLVSNSDRILPARMIRREQITVWSSVPSVVNLMQTAEELTAENLGSVRIFNFCGEALLPDQVHALHAASPGAVVQNTYGPTEATVSMTALRLRAGETAGMQGASVAIGQPIPGMALHLVGGQSPDEGEIVITGPQLAAGYWQDEERTAHAFRAVEVEGCRLRGYYTGDWAQRREGEIYFKDRIDFQVKVRGFRVELDEVAAAVRASGWPVVCVFKWKETLACVVEAVVGKRLDVDALRAELSARIESYAIPSIIRLIDAMPRNENDKLDRRAAERWLVNSEGAQTLPA